MWWKALVSKDFEKIERQVIYLMDSLKFQVSGSESIIEIEKLKQISQTNFD
jgi:hypothetical protein